MATKPQTPPRNIKRTYGCISVTFWTSAIGTRLVTIERGATVTIITKEAWDQTRKALSAEDAALYHLGVEMDGIHDS